MRLLYLAQKDLVQIFRDKKSLLFLAAMPMVFTVFIGIAYRGAASDPDPRLPVGWINDDASGSLSQQLQTMLADSDTIRLEVIEPSQSEKVEGQVRQGKLAAVLIVPPDFSQQILNGDPTQLILITNQMSNTGQSALQALRGPVTRLMSAVEVAHLDLETIEARQPIEDPLVSKEELRGAFMQASATWQLVARDEVRLVVDKVGEKQTGGNWLKGNPYNQASPGILVQFAIFGLVASAQMPVLERKTRTLQRMMTTSMRPWEVVAGHLLAMFAVVFAQEAILVIFGQFAFGVDYFTQPLAALLVMISLGLWIAGMGLFLGMLAKGEEQVILFTLIAMFLFSALGGTWFPLELAGKGFSTIGRLTPAAWAMDGFQDILLRGQGLVAVWQPVAILVAYALGFFGLAVWRFRVGQEA